MARKGGARDDSRAPHRPPKPHPPGPHPIPVILTTRSIFYFPTIYAYIRHLIHPRPHKTRLQKFFGLCYSPTTAISRQSSL